MGAIVKLPQDKAEWARLAVVALAAAGAAIASELGLAVEEPSPSDCADVAEESEPDPVIDELKESADDAAESDE